MNTERYRIPPQLLLQKVREFPTNEQFLSSLQLK